MICCFPPLPSPARSLEHFLRDPVIYEIEQTIFQGQQMPAHCRFSAPEKTQNAELRFFSSSSSFSFCFLASCFSNDRTQAQPRILCTSWLKVKQYLLNPFNMNMISWSHVLHPNLNICVPIHISIAEKKQITSSCACEQTPIPNQHHLPATHFG